jgi:hypothetical protein
MTEYAQAQKPRIFNATPITTTGVIEDDTLYLNESTTFEPTMTTTALNSVNNLNEEKLKEYEIEQENKLVSEREENYFYQTNSKSNLVNEETTTNETNLYCLDDDYYEIPGLLPLDDDDEANTTNNIYNNNNNETETLSNVHSNYGQEFNNENDDEDDTGNISTSVNNNYSELNNHNNTLATNTTDESSGWSQPEGD